MTTTVYGYTSKSYPFGTVNGAGAALPTAAPTKMIVTSSYQVAPSERITIKIWNGALSGPTHLYQTVLDFGKDSSGVQTGSYTNLLDQEITLSGFAPASLSAWQTIIKASITCDSNTSTFTNPTENVQLYCYKNLQTNQPVLRDSPLAIVSSSPGIPAGGNNSPPPNRIPGGTTTGRPTAPGTTGGGSGSLDRYAALQGIQVQFFAKGTNVLMLTLISNKDGAVLGKIPAGSYDVRLYGSGFQPSQWPSGQTAMSFGVSDVINRWGDNASDTNQAADFGHVKTMFAGFGWVGYMIVEDFTTGRLQFRNELSDGTDVWSDQASFNFGRLYCGQSFIEFLGVGLDPAPV